MVKKEGSTTKQWIKAFRLRTLPLAMASIGMGTFLAAGDDAFDGLIFFLAISTTLFLQVLSNLSNDYGDYVHGADNDDRNGPSRAVQSGLISGGAMKRAIGMFVIFSLASGLTLIYVSFGLKWEILAFFLFLGLAAIGAAVTYTYGTRPYGYMGLGDLSVVLFFGLTGVMGSYYLYTLQFQWKLILPALSVGLFSAAVLNVNNIRDIESDFSAGKMSIPVRIGRRKSVIYHWLLLATAIACAITYAIQYFVFFYQFIFLLVLPLLLINALAVKKYKESSKLDPYLRQLAITTLIFVLTFGIGLLLN
jgi:1,4-dihydroxy-2-naphthoate polyprenyltransferase